MLGWRLGDLTKRGCAGAPLSRLRRQLSQRESQGEKQQRQALHLPLGFIR